MEKQNVNIVGIEALYNILKEIKGNLSFDLVNFTLETDFFHFINEKKINNLNLLIITKINNKDLFFKKFKNEKKKIFFLSKKETESEFNFNIIKYPIEIVSLIEKINIQLIKQKYNYQSNIKINDYFLDLNSKVISKNNVNVKLTEKEIDIILFLNENKVAKKISMLQNKVWGYSLDLETHTVETHIYRLRKKINDKFKDSNFILSNDEGYFIE